MKNKAFLYLALSIFLAFAVACKKDYPKDIPDWLKKKIRESKKRMVQNNGDCYGYCLDISEYYEPNYGIVYGSKGYDIVVSVSYYDFYGNYICSSVEGAVTCYILNFSPQFKRFIYSSRK